MIKTLNKLEFEEHFPNLKKSMNRKPTINFVLNSLRFIYPTIRNKAGTPLLPFLCNTVVDILARAIRQENEIKGSQIRKEEAELLVDDIILYMA